MCLGFKNRLNNELNKVLGGQLDYSKLFLYLLKEYFVIQKEF